MSFLFKPELRQAILEGRKWQTRRPVKDGERLEPAFGQYLKPRVETAKGRTKWEVDHDYACPYSRGKHGAVYMPGHGEIPYRTFLQLKEESKDRYTDFGDLLFLRGIKPFRIRVTGLKCEMVHEISAEDAQAEGFDDEIAFWWTWCDLYRKHLKKYIAGATSVDHARAVMRDWKFPPVWVVTFKLV